MAVAGEIVVELKLDDKNMAVVIKNVGGMLRQMQGEMIKTAGSVQRMEARTDSLSTKFRHLVVTMGNLRFVAMDINDVFLRLPASILKSAGELERLQVLMTGLSKQTDKAAKSAEGLKDFQYVTNFAKTAPFEISALADSFVKLKTAGIDPTDGSMKALVDSVARFGGTGETMKRASIAIQQMSGKGVISMEELRQQLGEAVPTAMKDMADGMGVSMAELAKIVQTGTLATGPALGKMFVQMEVNNAGAAAAMMTTWTGMLSKLKTEWELTAKFIADSGFGDAAKAGLTKATELLKSDDFKNFANSAGIGLANVTTSIISVVSTLVKYRDEIGLVVKAWLAYKAVNVASTLVGGAWEKAVTGYNKEGDSIKRAMAARAAKNSADATANAIESAALAKKMAGHAAELAAIQTKNTAGALSQAAYTKAVQANAAATAITTRAVIANTAAIAAQGTMLARATAAMVSSRFAVVGLTIATRAYSVAMGLAGGPIGLVIIALSALAYWYDKVANAAERSAERMARAKAGVSSKDDVADSIEEEAKAQKNLNEARAQSAAGDASFLGIMRRPKTNRDRISEAKELIDAEKRLADAKETRAKASVSYGDQQARTEVEARVRQTTLLTDAQELAGQREIALIKEGTAVRLAGMKEGSKEYQATLNQITEEQQIALVRSYGMRVNTETDAIKQAQTELSKSAKGSQQETIAAKVLAAAEERKADLEGRLKAINERRASKTTYKEVGAGKGAGGPTVSPIQKWINSLTEDKAALDVALSGMLSTIGKVDPVETALATARAKLATKAFNVPVKDKDGKKTGTVGPNEKDKALILEMVAQIARLESLKDDIGKVSSDIINGSEDYKKAMLFLTNPLAGEDGAKTNKFKELISKLQNDKASLLELATREGLLPEALIAKFEEGARQAAAIDLAATFKPVIEGMIALGPEYKHALQVMANPLGAEEFKESNQFDKILAKMKKTPEELRVIAAETGIAVEIIEGMLAKAREGSKIAATIDFAKSYRDLVDSNKSMSISIIQDDRVRAQTQIDLENSVFETKAALRMEEAQARGVDMELLTKMEVEHAQARKLRAEKNRLEMRTPVEKMADDFQQSMKKMEEAGATWGNSFVDMLVSSAETGKLEFGSFVKSVLADILKIQLQKSLGDPLKEIIGAGTSWLQSKMPALGTNTRDAGTDAAGAAAMEAARGLFKTREAADLAKQGLTSMTEQGTEAATKAMITGLSAQAQETLASGTFTGSITSATAAVYAFTAAMQASGGTGGGAAGGILSSLFSAAGGGGFMNDLGGMELPMSLGFANGGIMTSMGSMPLRKYAAGGIANSPQMAIFGEGAHNEAYVPLPDGRSIPVTMSGGGAAAPSVTVNVINQSGSKVDAQQGQPRFDGKQMILDVVLTAASQPGGFRDGMKGAMR